MKIVLIKKKDINKIYDFINKRDISWSYLDYPIFNLSLAKKLLCQRIEKLLQKSFIVAIEEKHNFFGFGIVEFSKWDSDYFGYKCAKIPYLTSINQGYEKDLSNKIKLIKKIKDIAKKNSIKFLCVKTGESDISNLHALEEEGFRIFGAYNVYSYNRKEYLKKARKKVIYPYKLSFADLSDKNDLINIAKNRCEISHFRNDPFLDKKKVRYLYSHWVKTAFDKKNVKIITIKDKKKDVGFVIIRLKPDFELITGYRLAELELVVINNVKKYFSDVLLKKILSLLFEKFKIKIIESEVHYHNIRASKYFIEEGFKITRSNYRFHLWV